jgi:hypothetical protein
MALLVLYIISKRTFVVERREETDKVRELEVQAAAFDLEMKQAAVQRAESWRRAKLAHEEAKLAHETEMMEIERDRARSGMAQGGQSTVEGHRCPHCNATITVGQVGPALRYGYCKHCKPTE